MLPDPDDIYEFIYIWLSFWDLAYVDSWQIVVRHFSPFYVTFDVLRLFLFRIVWKKRGGILCLSFAWMNFCHLIYSYADSTCCRILRIMFFKRTKKKSFFFFNGKHEMAWFVENCIKWWNRILSMIIIIHTYTKKKRIKHVIFGGFFPQWHIKKVDMCISVGIDPIRSNIFYNFKIKWYFCRIPESNERIKFSLRCHFFRCFWSLSASNIRIFILRICILNL